MPALAWQPSASLANLRQRAQILAQIRAYFASQGVLEVETPQLCPATVTDPHLSSIGVPGYGYLQAGCVVDPAMAGKIADLVGAIGDDLA